MKVKTKVDRRISIRALRRDTSLVNNRAVDELLSIIIQFSVRQGISTIFSGSTPSSKLLNRVKKRGKFIK